MKQIGKILLIVFWATLGGAAHAVTIPFAATIDSAQANRGNGTESMGTGTAALTYDTVTSELAWTISWQGLTGTITVAHFHGPAAAGTNAGVAQGITIPTGAGTESGTTSGSAILSASQATDLRNGLWYINIHTSHVGGGEIRGQVLQVPCDATAMSRQIAGTLTWTLLSLPCEAPSSSTMADLINDPVVAGNATAWGAFVYSVSGASGQYQRLLADSPIPSAGTGFWFISATDLSLTMPAGSASSHVSNAAPCATGEACFNRSIDHQSSWNLIGNPTSRPVRYADTQVTNDSMALGCSAVSPCALDDAAISVDLFQYNEFSQRYDPFSRNGDASSTPPQKSVAGPWDGYWIRINSNMVAINSDWQLFEKPFPSQFIFVTDTTVPGSLIDTAAVSAGGVAGASAICQAEARAAGLPGNYQAYISDAGSGPGATLFQFQTPYIRPDGATFAADFNAFINGTAGASTDLATTATLRRLDTSALAWTGVSMSNATAGPNCANWTSVDAANNGETGRPSAIPGSGEWENTAPSFSTCDTPNHIYCVATQ